MLFNIGYVGFNRSSMKNSTVWTKQPYSHALLSVSINQPRNDLVCCVSDVVMGHIVKIANAIVQGAHAANA